MLLCPKCKAEYEEGYTVCSDCGCELIEQPEVQEEKEDLKIIQFIIGILIILGSTMFSYKLTSMYFTPHGNGEYITEHFIWMLKAYHFSFILAGLIICLPCIIYWCKGKKKEC
jgi:predicted nucleic acid-binding Zn ribbon protein